MLRRDAQEELNAIQRSNGGVLRAQDVLAFARSPDAALHSYFEWDDSQAAELFRLQQARAVIRLSVTVISEDMPPLRAFVSLPTDRANGGGYRSLVDVVNDEVRRGEMLQDALARLHALRRRYAALERLAPIWEAIDKANDRDEDSPATRAAG